MPKKTERGDPSVSRYGMLSGERGKPFWFSSLDQMIQFGAIKFCRTFKNYFGQYVWIEENEKRFTMNTEYTNILFSI